jgi:hypothetical protein
MKAVIIVLACLLAIASAAPKDNGDRSGMSELTPKQHQCITKIVHDNDLAKDAFILCHATGQGIDCVKKIAALAPCFV